MSTNPHDARTVAREISGLSSDDALTRVYVRSDDSVRPLPARRTRRTALFQTMTVRAVAALSGAVDALPRDRTRARRARKHWIPWWSWIALVLGAGLVGSATALFVGAGFKPARSTPTRPAPPSHPAPAPAPAPVLVLPRAPAHLRAPRRPATPASAADQLIAGDVAAALESYRRLATAHPDQPVYAAIVRILERDLARRCDPETAAPETPCTP